jgi:hypothetical protein
MASIRHEATLYATDSLERRTLERKLRFHVQPRQTGSASSCAMKLALCAHRVEDLGLRVLHTDIDAEGP